jgi:hypothetical protein
MLILISLFCVIYLSLSLWRLNWAVLLLLAALPAYLIRFQIFGIPATLLEAMILIAFGVWFFKNFLSQIKPWLKNWGKQTKYPFLWEIVLMIVISYVAASLTFFNNGSLSALGIWKAYFVEPI